MNSLTKEQEEHQAYKPAGSKAKHNDLKVSPTPTHCSQDTLDLYSLFFPLAPQNWFDKLEFLEFEIRRFQVYYASLFNNSIDLHAKLPSGLVPSPSISTLATSGTGDGNSELSSWKSITPPSSPKRHKDRKTSKPGSSSSPLTSSRRSHGKN